MQRHLRRAAGIGRHGDQVEGGVGPPLERASGEAEDTFLARAAAAIDAVTSEGDRLCGVTFAPREREQKT